MAAGLKDCERSYVILNTRSPWHLQGAGKFNDER